MVELSRLMELRTICAGIEIDTERPFLIISAPQLDAISATAVLCRVLYENTGEFHVTFLDAISTAEKVANAIDQHAEYQPIVMGIEIIDDGQFQSLAGQHKVVFIGGSAGDDTNAIRIGEDQSIAAAAYVFAHEKFGTNTEELLPITLIGCLGANHSKEDSRITNELVTIGTEKSVIRETRGLRLFGLNFLPLVDAFLYSIRPFMRGLSGNREGIEKLIESAEIPFAMRGRTISALNTEQKRHLIANLIPHLDEWSLTQILGPDYEILSEREDSPLRYMSYVRALVETFWMRQQQGLALGILIGDRAQILRRGIDTYLSHVKEITDSIQNLLDSDLIGHNEKDDPVAVVNLSTLNKELIPDIGRILLENSFVQQRYVIVEGSNSVTMSWRTGAGEVADVLKHFYAAGLVPVSTSSTSVMFYGTGVEMIRAIKERAIEYVKKRQGPT